MHPVRLDTDRLVLREFSMDDVDQAMALVGDDRVTTWLSFDSRTREQAHSMLAGVVDRARHEPRTEYYLAAASDRGDIVGFVRLGLNGVQAAKLGYAVGADHWGKGYATETARAMLEFGFTTLGLHRISAAIGPNNTASITLIHKLGFTYEGTIRDHVHTNGAWRDSALYSLLTHEWAAHTASHTVV